MCILEPGSYQEEVRSQVFCGYVKSFNTRRGFGFVSCEETALRFGRDVYLSKDEAMLLAAEPGIGTKANEVAAGGNEHSKAPPPVQEGDVLLFQVKLSAEGFPQAVEPRKIRRLKGVVQEAPSSTAEGIIIVNGDASDREDWQVHDDMKELLGAEVRLQLAECGQMNFAPNDEVAFCCVNTADTHGKALDAQLVELLSTSRPTGSFLGCFSLMLPQLSLAPENAGDDTTEGISVEIPSVELHGYASTDCIFLSDVPADVSKIDIMNLFGKLGGKDVTAYTANFDSIAFGGPEQVAKFLTQTTHAISKNGLTKLAQVGPCLDQRFSESQFHCLAQSAAASDEAVASTQTSAMASTDMQLMAQTGEEAQMSHPGRFAIESVDLQPMVHAGQQPQSSANYIVPSFGTTPSCCSAPWRCIHNNIVLPPEAPEMAAATDTCCSACIQWPLVIHASAYVVELLDQGTMIAQQFMRPMPEGVVASLVDLRVDGLQPNNEYFARVRCVAPCGCESAPSPWSFLPAGSIAPSGTVPLAPQILIPNAPMAAVGAAPQLCPTPTNVLQICPPPSAPPSLPLAATTSTAALPPIPEEAMETGPCSDEVLTLD